MPQISTIVPIYKVEAYLNRCIDSVLSQTFTDFELILVDDGSPDNCGKICDEYAKKDNRIRVIHKENGGLSSARNAGIDWAMENSDSDWLCFIDSDDWIDPHYLEYLYRAAIDNNVEISVCNVLEAESHNITPETYEYSATAIDWKAIYVENNVWATVAWNKLYKKCVFNGNRYPVGKIHEDEFLTYKLLYNVKKVAWVKAKLYFYFRRNDSITLSEYSLKKLDRIDAFREQVEFFKDIDHEIYKKAISFLLRDYVYNLKNLRPLKEHRNIYLEVQRDNKQALKEYGKVLGINIFNNPYLYNGIFPRLMRVYWAVRLTGGKIKRAIFK